jgi:hypothetical protein
MSTVSTIDSLAIGDTERVFLYNEIQTRKAKFCHAVLKCLSHFERCNPDVPKKQYSLSAYRKFEKKRYVVDGDCYVTTLLEHEHVSCFATIVKFINDPTMYDIPFFDNVLSLYLDGNGTLRNPHLQCDDPRNAISRKYNYNGFDKRSDVDYRITDNIGRCAVSFVFMYSRCYSLLKLDISIKTCDEIGVTIDDMLSLYEPVPQTITDIQPEVVHWSIREAVRT